MKTILFIQSSLSPDSRSFLLLQKTMELAQRHEVQTELLDLRQLDLPFCDGRALSDYSQELHPIYEQIEKADYIVFGAAIYCYSISGPLKNFIDLFSKAFRNKRFGICAAAGSKMSYLATSDLVRILGYESNATGIQPMVLTDYNDFKEGEIVDPTIVDRIERMLLALISFN